MSSTAWLAGKSVLFYYNTSGLNFLVYRDNNIISTLSNPVYLTHISGRTIHCLDRSARPRTITFDPTEYRFKLSLLKSQFQESLHIIKTSSLLGQSIIGWLWKNGWPEIALHFVKDPVTRFELALESGNLTEAEACAVQLERKDSWERLAATALKVGNHQIVEKCYQRMRAFDKLSFLYLITGSKGKLQKMGKIAEARGEPMSRFQNAVFLGGEEGVRERVAVLRDVGMCKLSFFS
jgi:coatomer subunit alpha